MPEIQIFTESSLPSVLKKQIISYLKTQWPEGFSGKQAGRTWVGKKTHHPIHFVCSDDDIFITYVGVVWKFLIHNGVQYKIYGLTGVFTNPRYRHRGFAAKTIRKVKQYIENKTDGDVVLFTSKLKGFYERIGFERMDKSVFFEGSHSAPSKHDETIYMLFLSEKGKIGKFSFETHPIYFYEEAW